MTPDVPDLLTPWERRVVARVRRGGARHVWVVTDAAGTREVDSLVLRDARFVIDEPERLRAVTGACATVHAWVEGTVAGPDFEDLAALRQVLYRVGQHAHFVRAVDGTRVDAAALAVFTPAGDVFVVE